MIKKSVFGETQDGKIVYKYSLCNPLGSSLEILTMGGIINRLVLTDYNLNRKDVVCGYDNLEDYLSCSGYQGAIIGRFGNRISNSAFTLDGKEYKLYNNEGLNHLHGGKEGFDKKIFDARAWEVGNAQYLELTYLSKDMEEGYPGNLSVKILYSFTTDNTLTINYTATTDKKTVVNLTNHAYFNLDGYDSGKSIEGHKLWIDSDRITVVNDKLIPTGEELSFENTPFDFREEKLIKNDINDSHILMRYGQGYDHNYILNADGTIKHVATLKDSFGVWKMHVYTDQPCMQIYTANCINEEEAPFKSFVRQRKRCAICMETQHAPDSPNHENFESCVLNPGELYNYTTIFKFENKK